MVTVDQILQYSFPQTAINDAAEVRRSKIRPIAPIEDRMQVMHRLEWYWQIEAVNSLLMPCCAITTVLSLGGRLSMGLLTSLTAMSVLIGIGAAYWRSAHRRRSYSRARYAAIIGYFKVARTWALTLIVLALVALLSDEWLQSPDTVTRILGWVVWIIAVLEFVNYYAFQLQYFDRRKDLAWLLKFRRPKRAHLARSIQRHGTDQSTCRIES